MQRKYLEVLTNTPCIGCVINALHHCPFYVHIENVGIVRSVSFRQVKTYFWEMWISVSYNMSRRKKFLSAVCSAEIFTYWVWFLMLHNLLFLFETHFLNKEKKCIESTITDISSFYLNWVLIHYRITELTNVLAKPWFYKDCAQGQLIIRDILIIHFKSCISIFGFVAYVLLQAQVQ